MHTDLHALPSQALSNQKLYELQRRFGTTRCGLQTGDTSLNTDAVVVVMTTEILRNIMYRTAELAAADGEAQHGSAGRERWEGCGRCRGAGAAPPG